ncbi:RagB/SusD family nutrient uptake outer membrane protein [Flavisolibacter nicotianae]|uniref:RagB/SusD family nutrient uptake outer membrane protein n=1 Tax=Flavisolibacter nicotianae TaxID=2364882 RepID=UPI000EAD5623|nr:RagB/SusD family nutrient uptake outer membrane protein [Flavisolibacter nicotianae]
MKKIIQIPSAIGLFILLHSCTKLETNVYDKVTRFWQTPEQVAAGVAPAYTKLRDIMAPDGMYALLEISSDEIIVPTRGGDWADNGIWRDLWMHTWTPGSSPVENGWQFLYSAIARVNTILKTVEALNPKPATFTSIQAELKIIRAFYYLQALDLFGNVPIVYENADVSCLKNTPRADVFAFVEKEIKDNLPQLTTEVNSYTYGRATQWFAYAMLAKLYLNAMVYTGRPRWADCIAACDAILNSKHYLLETDFFANFSIANESSKENIFVIPFDREKGLDFFGIQLFTLNYVSNASFGLEAGGVNGLCSPAAIYQQFDSRDRRRKMFLVGQQYINQVEDPAHLQYDRLGHPLIFDPVITTFRIPFPQAEGAGARCAKWEFNKQGFGNMSNDFAIYRLADIILMKAEAQFRNGDVAAALTTINQKIGGVSIRSRAGMPDFSAGEMNLDGLQAERERELSWEGHRRTDLIRFGHFTDARTPEKGVSENYRTMFPIPEPELAKNPCLVQNPGY